MKELQYVIPLDPRTKKNHMRIVGSGKRCPVCKRAERQYVVQGKAHDLYHVSALRFLNPKPQQAIDYPVSVRYLFYMKTRRRVDENNLVAAADDLLVDAGILKDDNSNILVHHDGTRVMHDKENPRTEIYIFALEDHENE